MSKKIVMNRKPKVLYQSKPLQMAENTLQLRRPMSVLSLTNNKTHAEKWKKVYGGLLRLSHKDSWQAKKTFLPKIIKLTHIYLWYTNHTVCFSHYETMCLHFDRIHHGDSLRIMWRPKCNNQFLVSLKTFFSCKWHIKPTVSCNICLNATTKYLKTNV